MGILDRDRFMGNNDYASNPSMNFEFKWNDDSVSVRGPVQ